MPISSLTRKTGLLPGNGVTRDFPFAFKVFQPEDLRVLRTSPGGGKTVLSYPSDYSVTLNADQDLNPGGNVRATTAPAAGYSILILSAVPEIQPVDLQNQGGFYPDVVNQMVDRNTIAIQQLAEQADRSFALPVTATGAPGGIPVPTPVGGAYLAWNEDGTALVNVDPAETTGFAVYGEAVSDVFNADGVETVFELSEDAGSASNLDVSISGVTQVTGTDFTWLGGNLIEFTTAPPDGTVVFVRYQRVLPQADIVDAVAAAQAAAQAAGEDRVQTGLDRIATGEDRVQTGLDREQTGLDRIATGEDRIATGEDRVQTGLDAAAAEAARDEAVAATAGKADLTAANLSEGNKSSWRAALTTAVIATASVLGLSETATAQAAYAASIPYLKQSDTDVLLDVSATAEWAAAVDEEGRHAVLVAAFNWQGRQFANGYGELGIKMPLGLIDIGARQFLRTKGQPRLYLEANSSPDFPNVVGISALTNISGDLYEFTITVDADLGAHVVPKYQVTLQNLNANNDARAFEGGYRVLAIDGTRRIITVRRRFAVVPTVPTTITNGGTSNSLLESKLVVPKSCLVGAWTSAGFEGMFTLFDGAQGRSKWMGFGSYNDADTQGCLVQLAGMGSHWESVDYDSWGIGPDRAIRVTFGGEFYANRTGFGGDGHTGASELIGTQGGGFVGLVRCMVGGGRRGGVSLGQGTAGYIANCTVVGGSSSAFAAVGAANPLCYPNNIGFSPIGILADACTVICHSGNTTTNVASTTIKCTLGLDGVRGGTIIGPTHSSGDTVASWARLDMTRNGATYRSAWNHNPTDGGRGVAVPNNQMAEALLTGTYGIVTVISRNSLADMFHAQVRANALAGGNSFLTMRIGTDCRDTIAAGDTPLNTGTTDLGALTLPVNAGRKTFNVWDAGSECYLQILNEDGADRVFDIFLSGDLALGEITVA